MLKFQKWFLGNFVGIGRMRSRRDESRIWSQTKLDLNLRARNNLIILALAHLKWENDSYLIRAFWGLRKVRDCLGPCVNSQTLVQCSLPFLEPEHKEHRGERNEGLPGDYRRGFCSSRDTVPQLLPWGIWPWIFALCLSLVMWPLWIMGLKDSFSHIIYLSDPNQQNPLCGIVSTLDSREVSSETLICQCWHEMKNNGWPEPA